MAIFVGSALLGEIRGSFASITISRNRAGQYFRNRAIPVNPSTDLQDAVRVLFTNLVNFWRSVLTPAERESWEQYAASVSLTNKVGEAFFATGQNHYIRSNMPRLQGGFTRIDSAPVILDLGEKDPTFAATGGEAGALISVVFDDTLDWVDEDDSVMLVYAGIPVELTNNYFKGPWRYASAIEGDGITPETSPKSLPNPFIVTQGQRQFAYARISRADGRLTEPFRSVATVGA